MNIRLSNVVLLLVLAHSTSVPLLGHHGAATFDTENEVTLKGAVMEWRWSNPHCFLRFEVTDPNGTVTTWTVETSHPIDMVRRGWSRTTFAAGDEVTITLQPVKSGAPIGRIRSVVLSDGQKLGA